MELDIKAAATLYKMARSTIYNKMEKGELSRLPNGKLDYTELLRVFGEPANRKTRQEAKAQTTALQDTQKETVQEAVLREQVRMLQEALRVANGEKEWLRDKVDTLTDTVKLLQAPAPQKRGLLSRFFGD